MDTYALIWKAHETDEKFDQHAFNERMPALFDWLKQLKRESKLLACGGGGFEFHPGGLTIILAESPEEAQLYANQSPLSDLGTTEIFFWGLYFADLSETKQAIKLE